MAPALPTRHVAHYERVLGTSMELQIVASPEAASLAEETALVEIDRLEAIFSRYRDDSELARWERTHDEPVPVSAEFAEVLRYAERWREATAGAFDPTMSPESGPRWSVEGETARRLTHRSASLNALAKGYIVDRAAAATFAVEGVAAALLNIGGDIRHLGPQTVTVEIADPFAPWENAPPLARIPLRNQGVATSGSYRRGAHLIDPQTGAAVEASATVVGPTCVEADALATALTIMPPREGLDLAEHLGFAALVVLPDRKRHSNRLWRRLR